MTPLSVVIITFNEQENIGRCIDSVAGVADEVVVIDSGSSDDTVKIALAKGAKVYGHPFAGHIEQKNYAITRSAFPHILSLDADEALSDKLRQEILKVKDAWEYDGYYMNRLNNYCGRWIRHGAWYPDRKLRLWDSRKGRWGGMNPHDRFEMDAQATTSRLKGDLLHYSYRSVTEHRNRSEKYAKIGAQAYLQQQRRSGLIKMLLNPLSRFVRDYFIRLGILDGYYGLVIAWINSREVFLKYKELYKLS